MTVEPIRFPEPPVPPPLPLADIILQAARLIADRQMTADVHVAAPVCSHTDPAVHVSVPGMDDMAVRLASIDAKLGMIVSLLARPVTRTVERDTSGRIETVRETR